MRQNLIFGISPQTNNGLGSATVFTTNTNTYFTTVFFGSSFDFYGRNVFAGVEQQPVTGASYVGPFWAY